MTEHTQTHIEEADKLAYVDGELDETMTAAVDRHLAVCTDCRDAVDDLAAASDSLTAYLRRADFAPRVLTYRGVRTKQWWTRSWAIAASLIIFWGLAAPGAWMMLRNMTPAPAPAPVAPASVATTLDVQPSAPVSGVEDTDAPVLAPTLGFTVEVTSWQTGGSLTLLFTDSDVVVYNAIEGDGTTSSINTLTGRIVIGTTADSRAIHEVVLPDAYGPENVIVRIAGQVVPFTVTTESAAVRSMIDATVKATARVDLVRVMDIR